MLSLVGKIAKGIQMYTTNRHESHPNLYPEKKVADPSLSQGTIALNIKKGKPTLLLKGGHGMEKRPFEILKGKNELSYITKKASPLQGVVVRKNMLRRSNILPIIEEEERKGGARTSSERFMKSPDRGFGDIMKCLSNGKSMKIPPATNPSPLSDMSAALIFPSLAIGLTAWWCLLPDHVICSTDSLSLFDPECLRQVKESVPAAIESSSGIGAGGIEQAFDPIGDAKKAKVMKALHELNISVKELVYENAGATVLAGALLLVILLTDSGGNS